MKAITIWQPYAVAIRMGLKHYETRSWPTKYRGPIVIHAAQKQPVARERELIQKHKIPADKIEYGVPILVCEIEDCILITKDLIKTLSTTEIDFGNWCVGGYAWKLKIIKKLNGYNRISGQQGMWNIELGKK